MGEIYRSAPAQQRVFAVGDIHGCHARLIALMERLPIDKECDTLVFLGDYINRGPETAQVIDTLIEIQKSYEHVIFLKGNHEQALLEYADTGDVDVVPTLRVMGVEATASCYGSRVRTLQNLSCFPKEHQNFLRELRFSYIWNNYVFVHADITDELLLALCSGQTGAVPSPHLESVLLSSRRLIHEQNTVDATTIVFGHSPFLLPLVLPDRICIDTGAVYGNMLTAVELPGNRFYHA